MKVFIVLALATVACASVLPKDTDKDNTAFSFIEKYAIPLGDKIRKAEERIQTRIIGGSATRLGEIPYQAGILGSYINLSGYGVCGGSLVSANRVLTAAHCWYDGFHQAWLFTVVLGSMTLFSGGTRIDTSAVVMHPQWDPSIIRNDVAVIYLPSTITYSVNIRPIVLPSGSDVNMDFAGAIGVASGFGLTQDGGLITANQYLSHVELNVITNEKCSSLSPIILQESNICTSSTSTGGTCNGDSGGPLAVRIDDQPVLIGIASFSVTYGCDIGWPAFFSRVTSFLDFFNQHI